MNSITKTIAKAFGMMMMLTVTNVQAQWTTLKAHIHESDISKLTGQSYQNYKGLDAAAFEIIGSVEAVKDKDQVKFMLRTQSINMVKYYMYSYRPALKLKRCTYGKLEEFERNGVYYPNEIGEAPFEAAMRTATATFDIEVSFLVKDKKYGKGYRAIRIFKNVKANDVVWADELLETNAPIEDIKLLNNPKPVSFKINDSAIQTAVLDFVAKQNQEAETRCKENDTDKKKKDEEAERVEANAKEIAKMKEKLGGTINVTSNSAETDDFWSGGEEKSTVSKSKDDDFGSGGKDKGKANGGSSNLEAINKDGRIYLKDAYGIIKEWDANKYYRFSKLDGSNDFFILEMRAQGIGFLSQNRSVIVDKRGNTVKIDGEEAFADITLREGGGYTVITYMSNSLYEGQLFNGGWKNSQDLYASSSDAINDVKLNIERIKEERRQKAIRENNQEYQLGFMERYNVVEVKEVITSPTMQALIKKTGFKVR